MRDELQKVSPALKGFDIPVEPAFLSDLKEIIAYFVMSPCEAVLSPQVFEEVLGLIAIGSGNLDYSKWSGKHNSVTMKLAKDLLQFVSKSCAMTQPSKTISEFLSLQT